MSTLAPERVTEVETGAGESAEFLLSKRNILCSSILALCALLIALFHNFSVEHPPVTMVYDSGHYLKVTQTIAQFLIESLRGHMHSKMLTTPEFIWDVKLDGPILPTFFAALFTLLGKVPQLHDVKLFIVVQCIFHALDVFLIWMLGFRLSANRLAASIGACSYMLYPAALLQTERFLTEPFATLLLLLFALTITNRNFTFKQAVISGALAALVFMLKSALVIAIALAVILKLFIVRPRGKFVLGSLLGLVLTVAPWAVYSYLHVGRVLFTADREVSVNFALGFDRECEGVPAILRGPFCRMVFDLDAPVQSASGLFVSHPLEYIGFFFHKATKLICLPWNDFNDSVFGVGTDVQRILHLFFAFAAILGVVSFLANYKNVSSDRADAGTICLALILGHFAYTLVQPMPRYMITSTPLLAVFIGLAVAWALKNGFKRSLPALAIASCLTGLVLGVYYGCRFETSEKTVVLNSGQSLLRNIDLSRLNVPVSLDAALLLVDGSNLSADTRVVVNGTELPDRLLPIYEFDPTFYSGTARDSLMTIALRSMYPSYYSLRQWNAIYVPRALIKTANNTFALTQKHGQISVYADPLGTRRLPTLELISVEKIFDDPVRADGRFLDPVVCANTVNAEKFVLQEQDGTVRNLDCSVRMKLLFGEQIRDAQANKYRYVEPGDRPAVVGRAVDPSDVKLIADAKLGCSRANRQFLFNMNSSAGSYLVKISGQAKRLGGGSSVSLKALVTARNGRLQSFAQTPTRLDLTNDWQYFDVEGIVPSYSMHGARRVDVEFYPKDSNLLDAYGLKRGCCDAIFRDVKVTITPVYIPACTFDRRVIM